MATAEAFDLSIAILTKAVYFDHTIFTFLILRYSKTMMKLNYQNESARPTPAKLFKIILARLPALQADPKGLLSKDVELLLTDDQTIHALNKQYRGKDKPTDVLSFAFDDPEHLGQIVISVETAQIQADQIGQSLQDELQFLFTHGLLHLLGYDHEKPEDEKIMLKKTHELLDRKQIN